MINNSKKFIKILFCASIIFVFLFPLFHGLALTPQEEKQALEVELKQLEEQIAKYENDVSITQQEKKTLQNQISILKKKIATLDLEIKKSNVLIKDVGFQIQDTEKSIEITSSNIGNSQQQLSQILLQIYEEDQRSLTEILLSSEEISDFFENLSSLEGLSEKSCQLLQNIKQLKVDLNAQKDNLDSEKGDLENLLAIQTLQKKASQQTQVEKNQLLDVTKGKEALYQKSLEETRAKAAAIRKRIFELAGVPKAPTFGEALDIAKYAGSITGVRPAFLLAILTQESNLGKNVGQCYLANATTGAGTRINDGGTMAKTMSPKRDVPIFLQITQALNRDPYKTQVSCPMSFGWGGAMGPAQFIPSTWNLYDERVSAITGKPADPWNITDAFLAAALYTADYGAASQSQNGEWKAAMIYFSGSTNTRYRFYGDSVMSLAAKYQADIDTIENAK